MTDEALLQRYVREGSHTAFAELVGRHVDLVYAVARRHVGSTMLAEDVAQSVFLDLARQAGQLKSNTPLIAWLHVVARRTAIDTVRREARRRALEQQAAALASTMPSSPPEPDWPAIEPLLDEAVESLPSADRTAILLRFFENKSLRDVGAALSISDDAAQKRVARALDQLRVFFTKRGIAATAIGLSTTLSAHAFHAAPAALGTTISTAATLTLPAGATLAAAETSRVIAMTTLQKSLAAAALVAMGGFGLYEATLAARSADALAALQREIASANSDLHALRRTSADSTARLRTVETQLDERLAATAAKSPSDLALEQKMHEWMTQMAALSDFLARRPDLNTPELQLLPRETWFEIAGGVTHTTDEDFRRTAAALRDRAQGTVSSRLSTALRAYARANNNTLPNSLEALVPFLEKPLDPALLNRYTLLRTGNIADIPMNERTKVISLRVPADPEFDRIPTIGPSGHSSYGALFDNVASALAAYTAANEGRRPVSGLELKPYLKWPLSDAAVQRQFDRMPSRKL